MCLSTRSAEAGLRDPSEHPGEWMRRMFRSAAAGTTFTAPSTSMERRSTSSCAETAGSRAAQAFFRKALATLAPRVPRKITLDGHVPSRRALWLLRREQPCWRNVNVRTSRYLNNIVEQDHRAIKRRCASMAGFKSFRTTSRAGSVTLGAGRDVPQQRQSPRSAEFLDRRLQIGLCSSRQVQADIDQ